MKDTDAFIAALKQCRKIETWNMDLDALARHLRAIQPDTFAGMCESVYCFYANGKDLKVWGDKNNYYVAHIAILERVFPSALYIHLVRDGRDVACSYRKVMNLNAASIYAPKLPTQLGQIAEQWANNVLTVESHFEGIATDRHITVRYEDLVDDPSRVLSSICSFLGVPYSGEMLDYHKAGKHDEPPETMEWKMETRRRVDPSNKHRYSKELSAQELLEFNRTARDALCRFEYPLGEMG
jgi:hypothetical protein